MITPRIPRPNIHQFDFIVIGSGVAGLFAALHLAERGRVAVITKDALTESNTEYAQGGIAVALGEEDSPEDHARDTLEAGAGLCSPEAVEILTREGPGAVEELMRLGMRFDREGGELVRGREAAHGRRRILHASGDETGHEVVRSLSRRAQVHPSITVFEHTWMTDLLVVEGRCVGCDAMVHGEEERVRFVSSAIILASGGLGQIYAVTTNPLVTTGDGMAAAWRAGCRLMDMEFIQFHPTALYHEGSPKFLISEAVRGEGAVLRNGAGDRFMPSHHPLGDLAPRDVVARAVFAEMRSDGRDFVELDFSSIPLERFLSRFPGIVGELRRRGFDIYSERIPVAPAAHYAMAGIASDLQCRTDLPGLLAIGECACIGLHGANRLASNSILEGLVFGVRAAQLAPTLPRLSYEELGVAAELAPPPVRVGAPAIRPELQRLMQQCAGMERNEEDLREAREQVATWARGIATVPAASREEAEAANMVTIARLALEAALTRTESRGAHYRLDFPAADEAWRRHLTLRADEAGEPVVGFTSVEAPAE
ncbi:MAG: L-aspartate oxidase [candidate division WS1 bacterium]|jgi:L-aspartate oxidase|nr:L-aspartate oxidase [candidate division WS1 bacterium]